MSEHSSNSAASLTLITLQTTRCQRGCRMVNDSHREEQKKKKRKKKHD